MFSRLDKDPAASQSIVRHDYGTVVVEQHGLGIPDVVDWFLVTSLEVSIQGDDLITVDLRDFGRIECA